MVYLGVPKGSAVHMRVRLPPDLYDALIAASDERDISPTKIVEKAVAEHLGWRRHRQPGEQRWTWGPGDPLPGDGGR